MRSATALVELLDQNNGVVASTVAPIQAVIDGTEVVLLIECMVRCDRPFAMVAQRISAGRNEVEFRWQIPANIKPGDMVSISSRVETNEWRGVNATMKGANGMQQMLQITPPPPAARHPRWMWWAK